MTSTDLIALIGVILTALGLIGGIVKYFVSDYSESARKRILEQEFGRVPYDKATIERSIKYYIRPKCSNIDPAQELEPRRALMATREDLFEKVDFFLQKDESHRHLLILADSGMGKTSFAINYYAYNYQLPRVKRNKVAILPLGIRDPDTLIEQIPHPSETVIILDAFDEDTRAIKDHRERIRILMEKCQNFFKVIVTCRTQFFPRDEEIPVETGILRVSPTAAGVKKGYEFWKLYLSPFDDNDVKQYIHKRYPFWVYSQRKKAKQIVSKIPMLSVRPMLLAHIPDIIMKSVKIENSSQLYETMVEAWLDREVYWIDKNVLREYSERLAVEIFRHREKRGSEQVTTKELYELSNRWNIRTENWKLSSRSLLNRDATGNYKFAHRSIMEYLFTRRLVNGDEDCDHLFLTDQMKVFLGEMLYVSFPSIIIVNSLEGVKPEELDDTAAFWEAWFTLHQQDSLEDFFRTTNVREIFNDDRINFYRMLREFKDDFILTLGQNWISQKELTRRVIVASANKAIAQHDVISKDYEGGKHMMHLFIKLLTRLSDKELAIIASITEGSGAKLANQRCVETIKEMYFFATQGREVRSKFLGEIGIFIAKYGSKELRAFRSMNQQIQQTDIRIFPKGANVDQFILVRKPFTLADGMPNRYMPVLPSIQEH